MTSTSNGSPGSQPLARAPHAEAEVPGRGRRPAEVLQRTARRGTPATTRVVPLVDRVEPGSVDLLEDAAEEREPGRALAAERPAGDDVQAAARRARSSRRARRSSPRRWRPRTGAPARSGSRRPQRSADIALVQDLVEHDRLAVRVAVQRARPKSVVADPFWIDACVTHGRLWSYSRIQLWIERRWSCGSTVGEQRAGARPSGRRGRSRWSNSLQSDHHTFGYADSRATR